MGWFQIYVYLWVNSSLEVEPKVGILPLLELVRATLTGWLVLVLVGEVLL